MNSPKSNQTFLAELPKTSLILPLRRDRRGARGNCRTAFSDSVDPAAIGPVMTEFWKETLENFLTVRNRLRSNSFLDVKYKDLVCDPIGVVRELYRNLGDHLSNDAERRMRSFLSKHPKGKYGSHFYTTASFGLDTATLDQHFDSYRERFGLKNTKLIVEERASEG